jgi:hypothetical protein
MLCMITKLTKMCYSLNQYNSFKITGVVLTLINYELKTISVKFFFIWNTQFIELSTISKCEIRIKTILGLGD